MYNYASNHLDTGFWTSFICPRFPWRTMGGMSQKITELRKQGGATAAGRQLVAGTYDPELVMWLPRGALPGSQWSEAGIKPSGTWWVGPA